MLSITTIKFNIEEIRINEKKNFAYIKFKTKEEADQALKSLHLKDFKNYIIKAEPFKSNKKKYRKDNNTNLFVKHLPKDCTQKDFFEIFSKFGEIDSIKLKTNHKGACIGYGYVDFILEESANNAMEKLDQTKFKDNIISVTHFKPKEERMKNLNKNNQNIIPMIVVLKMPSDLDSEGLEKIFNIYGKIILSWIVNESPIFLLENGKYKERMEEINNISRYGIIFYTKKEEAITALKQVQEKYDLILTESKNNIIEKVKKEKHASKKAKYEGANLVIKNLPKEVDDKILFEIFRKYGGIRSARVQVQGVKKDIKDEKGNNIDKNYIYESKGFGYVLFKNEEDAQKAKNELNGQDLEYKGMKLKLLVENYDDYKGEKIRIENFKEMMIGDRGGYGNIRGRFPPHGRGGNRVRGRGFGARGGPHNQTPMNKGMDRNEVMQMKQALNFNNSQPISYMQNIQIIPNLDNTYINNNGKKITVEGVNLLDTIKEKLKIENDEERTEVVGETLFYFLLKFIQQYELNTTNGEYNDSDLCSKLTDILIKTEPSILLQIISTTNGLYNYLKDVLNKLIGQ